MSKGLLHAYSAHCRFILYSNNMDKASFRICNKAVDMRGQVKSVRRVGTHSSRCEFGV